MRGLTIVIRKKIDNNFQFKKPLLYRIFILAALLLILNGVNAQTLSPSVISSAGNLGIGTNEIIEWNLGEIAVETFTKPNSILCQGFLQNYNSLPNTTPILTQRGISIFPNPAKNVVFYSFNQPVNSSHYFEIFDTNGRLVIKTKPMHESKGEIEVDQLSAGIYYVKITCINGRVLSNSKFVKQ